MSSILVVDDKHSNRQLASYLLGVLGHTAVAAASAAEAYQLAKQQRFDLALVDLNMPGTDGLGLVAAFKADPDTHRLPMVLFTISATPDEHERAMQFGFVASIPKPSDPAGFMAAITTLVQQYKHLQAGHGEIPGR